MELPAAVPTKAVLETLDHIGEHVHEGVPQRQHFVAVLMESIGLQERHKQGGD